MPYQITLNSKQIKEKFLADSFNSARSAAKAKAEQEVSKRKNKFLQEFLENDITQQLLDPDSNFGINGVNGNLFSFLGFDKGAPVIQDLYKYLNENITVNKSYQYDKNTKTFIFKMNYPILDDLKEVTDMSKYVTESNDFGWGEGRSWVVSIERGIPGLSQYKFSTDKKILGSDSRSGTGLQRKNIIHQGSNYKPQKYISELLKILIKRG